MRAEIITVGTELILGQTLDTHSQYLSREAVSLGIDICYHTSVGDQVHHLQEVLSIAHARSDLVFLCGGLGPTPDDITKEVVSEFLQVPLVQDQDLLSDLEEYFAERSLKMADSNRKQSLVFVEGAVFPNPNGTAPGLAITKDKVTYFLLPGPPRELKPMFESSVRSFLMQRFTEKNVILSQSFSFFGIGESSLAENIDDLIQESTNPTVATYVQDLEIILRLTAKSTSVEEAYRIIEPIKKEIIKRVGKYCFSDKGQTLEEVVCHELLENRKTVAFVESCTGGLLTQLLTTVPGCSATLRGGLVCYADEMKTRLFDLPSTQFKEEGAVSQFTAEKLAEEIRKQFTSDFAISITGVAGPTTIENKPVGLVYISLAEKGEQTKTVSYSFKGDRKRIQLLAAKHALFLLKQRLKKGESTT